MDGGGDQKPRRGPTPDLDLIGEEGGQFDTLPMAFHSSTTRALSFNLSLSQLAMSFVIFPWHKLMCYYPTLQSLQEAFVR